jgi:hypothetical protein
LLSFCPFFATQPVRLYDLHLKDRFSAEVKSPNVEARRGLIDLADVLRRAAQAKLLEVHRVKFTPAQQRRRPR